MRGKINIQGTINNKLQRKQMLYFHEVDLIDTSTIQWNKLQFKKNNNSYKMLINICYFVIHSLLLSSEKGGYTLASFLDDQAMSRLYEKFVLEYYRFHHSILKPSASQISWNIDDGVIDFLPIMQTDITLKKDDNILIIDTKYYSHTMQVRKEYHSRTLHSNNLYQIFTYVKNKDVENTGNVSGMLLYAKTNEDISPDCDFEMSGNKISVKTLDLNTDFAHIPPTGWECGGVAGD